MRSLCRNFQFDMYFENRHCRVFLIDEIIRDIFTKLHATFIDILLTTTSSSTFLRQRLVVRRRRSAPPLATTRSQRYTNSLISN